MKKILFVCVENACRSQMAKGFCIALADGIKAESAGTQPAGQVDPVAVRIMAETGIDISRYHPKALSSDMNDRYDIIVTMGCIDGCPLTPQEKTIAWDIEDPRGRPVDVYRTVRDDIQRQVERLLADIS